MSFLIVESNFEEVLPIWRDHLWPGRDSAIEPTNPLKFLGGYDNKYMQQTAVFYKAINSESGDIVGVISGHPTEAHEFRLRGTYVFSQYRAQGIAKQLIERIEVFALKNQCKKIWLIPRKEAFGLFIKLGYTQASDWIDDEFEFGPNCFVYKDL